MWKYHGLLAWRDRAHHINLHELKAVRTALHGVLWSELGDRVVSSFLLHVESTVAAHVCNSFVSVIRPMMGELRRLKCVLEGFGGANTGGMDAIYFKSLCDRLVDPVTSRRFEDKSYAAAFHRS